MAYSNNPPAPSQLTPEALLALETHFKGWSTTEETKRHERLQRLNWVLGPTAAVLVAILALAGWSITTLTQSIARNTVADAIKQSSEAIQQTQTALTNIQNQAFLTAMDISAAGGRAKADADAASLAVRIAQQNATDAAASLDQLSAQVKSASAVAQSVQTPAEIALKLATTTSFAGLVASEFRKSMSFSLIRSDFNRQHSNISCASGAQLISATCVGRDGGGFLQAAVGPRIENDMSVSCDSYGPTAMQVQVSAICLTVK